MQASTDTDLWISSQEYDRAIEELALQLHQSGWRFDVILCLARGGLRPGDILSRIFNVPLAILSTSSYREAHGREQGSLDIARHITISKGSLAGNVLLVDDLVDSGITMQQVIQTLVHGFPEVNELKTAVIWFKACSSITPDYFVRHLQSNPWIHQPFEVYDSLSPAGLAARLKHRPT